MSDSRKQDTKPDEQAARSSVQAGSDAARQGAEAAQQGGRAASEALRRGGEFTAAATRHGAEAGAETARRAGDAASEMVRRGGQDVAESQRQFVQDAAERFEEVSRKVAQAVQGTTEDVRTLMALPNAAQGGLQDLQESVTGLVEGVVQTNLRATQELFRLANPSAVVELQQRFVREYRGRADAEQRHPDPCGAPHRRPDAGPDRGADRATAAGPSRRAAPSQ